MVSAERAATDSPIGFFLYLSFFFLVLHYFQHKLSLRIVGFAEYSDVAAYRLSLSEDTKALNQLVCGDSSSFTSFYEAL